MKNYKNYISIVVLILLLAGIIIAFSTISKSESLNTTLPTSDTSVTKEKFDNINSRTSKLEKIEYENNYGGSNDDEVFEVFKLNNYYLIGSTKSNDKYFNQVSGESVYVLILDNEGNVIKLNTISVEKDLKIISVKIYQNSIYILIKNKGIKLITYDISEHNFDIIYFDNADNAQLIVSSEPIVAILNGSNTSFYFVISDVIKVFNIDIVDIVLSCEYLNGTLLIYNSNNASNICILTLSGITKLKKIPNNKIIQFNITENNFVFITESNNNNYLKILDYNFNILNSTQIQSGSNYNIMWLNNTNIITYISNRNLYLVSYCEHATKILESKLICNVDNYLIDYKNEINIVTLENGTMNNYTFNLIGEEKTKNSFDFSIKANLVYFDVDYFNNFTIFGNYTYSNDVITTSFGNQDIFVTKVQK